MVKYLTGYPIRVVNLLNPDMPEKKITTVNRCTHVKPDNLSQSFSVYYGNIFSACYLSQRVIILCIVLENENNRGRLNNIY